MNVAQLLVKLGLDNKQFNSGMDQSSSKLRQMDKGADALTKSLKFAGLMGMAFMGKQALDAVIDLGKMGAQADRVRVSFEELARQAGGSADDIMAAIRRATAGTVAETDIMLAANKGILLGLGAQADQWEKLAEVARFRARAMGISMTQALGDISMGIGRESRLILDNLGLILDIDTVTAEYGRTIGKAADELTAFERKQAIMNAVITEGQAQIKAAGGIARDQVDDIEAVGAALKDAATAIGELLAPAVAELARGVADGVRAVNQGLDDLQDGIDELRWNKEVAEGATDLAKVLTYLGVEIDGLPALEFLAGVDLSDAREAEEAFGRLSAAVGEYGLSFEDVRIASGAMREDMNALASSVGMTVDIEKELVAAYATRQALAEALGEDDPEVKAAEARIQMLEGERAAIIAAMAAQGEAVEGNINTLRGLIDAQKESGEAAEDHTGAVRDLVAQMLEAQALVSLGEALGDPGMVAYYTDRVNELSNALKEIEPDMGRVESAGRGVDYSLQDIAHSALDAGENLGSMGARMEMAERQARRLEGILYDVSHAIAEVNRDARKVDVGEVGAGFRSATDRLTSGLTRLTGQIDLSGAQEIYDRYLTQLEDLYRNAADTTGSGTAMTELELEFRREAILNAFDAELDIIKDAARDQDAALGEISRQYRDTARGLDELGRAIQSALQPTRVTAEDLRATELGEYVDKWDEAARRLDAIAARGFAELTVHPDWAGALKIPEDVLASGEAALKDWAKRTSDDVRNLLRPDLLDMDLVTAEINKALTEAGKKPITVEVVTERLREGLADSLSGLDADVPVSLSLAPEAKEQLSAEIGTVPVSVSPMAGLGIGGFGLGYGEEGEEGVAGLIDPEAILAQIDAVAPEIEEAGSRIVELLGRGAEAAAAQVNVGGTFVEQLTSDMKSKNEAFHKLGQDIWGVIEAGFEAAMAASSLPDKLVKHLLPLIMKAIARGNYYGGGSGSP